MTGGMLRRGNSSNPVDLGEEMRIEEKGRKKKDLEQIFSRLTRAIPRHRYRL